METTVGRLLASLIAVGAAAIAALSLGYVAHYDLGLSRQEVRIPAVVAAAVIALLVAIEFFGKKLGKPK
jgi:Na+/melibiose symporter-like transporter